MIDSEKLTNFMLLKNKKPSIILVDHQDSFVHILENYFSLLGSSVTVARAYMCEELLATQKFDLMVLSPGPGTPQEFNCNHTIKLALDNNLPIFGVCLGLQALVEFFGGSLKKLAIPIHGKSSLIKINHPSVIFNDLPDIVKVGRYHSLAANSDDLPKDFRVTAVTNDIEQEIMAIEHVSQPIAAVQFHPESVMSMENNAGMTMIFNVINNFVEGNYAKESYVCYLGRCRDKHFSMRP